MLIDDADGHDAHNANSYSKKQDENIAALL